MAKKAKGSRHLLRDLGAICKKLAAASKPRKKARKKSARRDPAWYGQPRLHAKAAKLGHKRQGHKVKAKKSSARRDPALYRSTLLKKRGRGARPTATHPYYVMHDPGTYRTVRHSGKGYGRR